MAQVSTIPQQLMTSALLHFQNGVPIDDCNCRAEHKRRLARVHHVYWQWVRNPWLDYFAMFKQMAKGQYADAQSAWRVAEKDRILFDFVKDSVSPPSRRESEQKVRVTADRLMQMGAETDNGRDMAEGAKILMKLDRLDQPESEQADMAKVMFLPPVVTTSVKEVDETKEDVDDAEMKRIMQKYGGFVDEKEKDIDEMVEVMAAKGAAVPQQQTEQEEYDE
jgi:hypothetical protein